MEQRVTAHCQRKKCVVYACMPPKYTVVLNKFECPDIVKSFGGDFFVPNSCSTTDIRFEAVMSRAGVYTVDRVTPVVLCGTRGEYTALSLSDFLMWFTTEDGVPSLEVMQKQWVACVPNLKQDVPLRATFIPKGEYAGFMWSDDKLYHCNLVGAEHGKGDFIVGVEPTDADYQLHPRRVVNGLVFKDVFVNTGWGECLEREEKNTGVRMKDLPKFTERVIYEVCASYSMMQLKDMCDSCQNAEMVFTQEWDMDLLSKCTSFSIMAHALRQAYDSSIRNGISVAKEARLKVLVTGLDTLHITMNFKRRGMGAVITWFLTKSRYGLGLTCKWSVATTKDGGTVVRHGRRFIVPEIKGVNSVDTYGLCCENLIRDIVSGTT